LQGELLIAYGCRMSEVSEQARDLAVALDGDGDSERENDQQRLATELATAAGGFMRRLRAASPVAGLTPTQRSVLRRIADTGPTTIAALARAELVRPQSMRVTIGALEEQNILRRSPHPTDGRQVVLSLTDTGRDAVREMRKAKHDWLADALMTRLDESERRTLCEAATLLKRLTHE
jgi:DNA-binding MarR family transcriptional regulator